MKQLIYFVLTVVLTYELACLAQTVLHRFLGHYPIIRALFVAHTKSHHALYTGGAFEQPVYSAEERNLSYAFVPVALLIGATAYWLLPVELFAVSFVTLVGTFTAHIYLHAHYHLTDSWLVRFFWFRKLKELHRIHHINQRMNYGVMTLVWDRVMGTFAPAEPWSLRGDRV